jgi:ribosomal protein S18 acetylase RimI-like enzyme
MRVQDLGIGWQSHLLASRFGAEVIERDDCIVLRTPGNPTYYWGNCLILPAAPRDSDLAHWLRRFNDEIASGQAQSQHLSIGIDAASLDHPLPSWRAAGIDEFDETAVLTLASDRLVSKPPSNQTSGLQLRALDLPRELPVAVQAQVASRDASFEEAGYRVFRQRSMQRVAEMQAAGQALWFGAFADNTLAADCGLVYDGRMGRFQYVSTQPTWRRRGLCRALVHHVCRHAFDALGLQQLVMCADPHDVAIGIYRSVGFAQVETNWGLQRRPQRDRR